jgi:hypothetical protein
MGASNFHKVNADKYYVVCNHSPEEEGDADFGRWMIEDLENMFAYEVENNKEKGTEFIYSETRSIHELRSYPCTYIGSIRKTIATKGNVDEIDITYHCFIRHGYHEAGCLDWEREISFNGMDADDGIDLESFIYYSNFTDIGLDSMKGVATIMFNRLNRKLGSTLESLDVYVHQVFENISTPFVRTGGFSDDTSIYESVNKEQ